MQINFSVTPLIGAATTMASTQTDPELVFAGLTPPDNSSLIELNVTGSSQTLSQGQLDVLKQAKEFGYTVDVLAARPKDLQQDQREQLIVLLGETTRHTRNEALAGRNVVDRFGRVMVESMFIGEDFSRRDVDRSEISDYFCVDKDRRLPDYIHGRKHGSIMNVALFNSPTDAIETQARKCLQVTSGRDYELRKNGVRLTMTRSGYAKHFYLDSQALQAFIRGGHLYTGERSPVVPVSPLEHYGEFSTISPMTIVKLTAIIPVAASLAVNESHPATIVTALISGGMFLSAHLMQRRSARTIDTALRLHNIGVREEIERNLKESNGNTEPALVIVRQHSKTQTTAEAFELAAASFKYRFRSIALDD